MNYESDEESLLSDSESIHMSASEDECSDSSYRESCSEADSEEEDILEIRPTWKKEKQPTAAAPRFPFTPANQNANLPADGNPLDYFNLYFNAELINIIVTETNRYAAEQRNSTFSDTSANEIRVFLALTMLQGLVIKPSYWMYWTKRAIMDTPFFRECITLERFRLLKRYLHFSNNLEYDPENHPNPKLNKIYPIYERLSNKFKSLYALDRDVTIGESLMLYKQRHEWAQYIALKGVRSSIKLYMLCEAKTGYVWSTIINAGKGTVLNETYKTLPTTASKIVMSLMDPLLGKGHCLTTGSLYTSPQLADLLVQHQTDTYGTVKPTCRDLPYQIKDKALKPGEAISYRRGKLLTMKWKDPKHVTFTVLSTVHSSEMVNCKRNQEVSRIPRIVKDYNDTMGGVDRVDQSSNPITRRKGNKYYKNIFFNLLELAVWNSYILYKQAGHKKKSIDFRMELIELIITNYKLPSVKQNNRPSSSANPLRLTERHFPDLLPPTESKSCATRRCVVCCSMKNERGKKVRRETRYQCKECNVSLCIFPCFRIYHTKPDFSKPPSPNKLVTRNNLKKAAATRNNLKKSNGKATTSFHYENDVKSESEFNDDPWEEKYDEAEAHGGPIQAHGTPPVHAHEIYFVEDDPKLEFEDEMDEL